MAVALGLAVARTPIRMGSRLGFAVLEECRAGIVSVHSYVSCLAPLLHGIVCHQTVCCQYVSIVAECTPSIRRPCCPLPTCCYVALPTTDVLHNAI